VDRIPHHLRHDIPPATLQLGEHPLLRKSTTTCRISALSLSPWRVHFGKTQRPPRHWHSQTRSHRHNYPTRTRALPPRTTAFPIINALRHRPTPLPNQLLETSSKRSITRTKTLGPIIRPSSFRLYNGILPCNEKAPSQNQTPPPPP